MATTDLLIGSLCSGAGGLDLGVQAARGGHIAWHAGADPRAAQVFARHRPRTPQPGRHPHHRLVANRAHVRAHGRIPLPGPRRRRPSDRTRPGFRSGLWHHIVGAIRVVSHCLVIENVRNLLSTGAGSYSLRHIEPCPRCMGDPHDQSSMRALGVLLADLAGLGYEWWGDYLPAIRRWEDVIGCHAPSLTAPGTRRLSAESVDWMLLPQGWVTRVPGLSRATQLRLFGNTVVLAQAAHAPDILLHGGSACGAHADPDGAFGGGR